MLPVGRRDGECRLLALFNHERRSQQSVCRTVLAVSPLSTCPLNTSPLNPADGGDAKVVLDVETNVLLQKAAYAAAMTFNQ